MKSSRYLVGLLLMTIWSSGCRNTAPTRTGVWRASVDFGDKPGNGIELRIDASGVTEARFFILEPEKPHDFSAGIGLPMKIFQSSPDEILFSVDFGEGQVEQLRLAFPEGLKGDSSQAVLQDQEGNEAAIHFVFRRLRE